MSEKISLKGSEYGQTNPDDSRQDGRVAIVGIGCRLPGGAHTPESYWQLIRGGIDAIVDVPADRWAVERFYDPDPGKPGKVYVRKGGFLRHPLFEFDAMFFGIAPREASLMDPQQRLMLEVAWEALEDAGVAAEGLAGSNTGVFIGGFIGDNQLTQLTFENRDRIVFHTAVSATLTMLSNRISYAFDFRGPSVSMDTACSSSLVALHYACESVKNGESSIALVGGVNAMFRPESIISLCKGQFLAPDGHSKTFDERADGYGRGEGAAVLVLKRLRDAVLDGDRIYAVIRGTGVNQDGRTDGITVPNAEAQQDLMRRVCAQSATNPRQVGYVEAHGTGTAVGDPLEAAAIGAVYGGGRSAEQACVLGSVKANIGHTEACAGVAGTIKAALSLFHDEVAPLANLGIPNPKIPFAEMGLRLTRVPEAFPEIDGVRLAAINSFGYGGTNAHAILEAAPARSPRRSDDVSDILPYLLPISAKSDGALRQLARAYADLLERADGPRLRDICHAAGLRRSHLTYRLATLGHQASEIVTALRNFADGTPDTQAVADRADAGLALKPVFVFTGMGPQWWAMGRELLESEPVFRAMAEECDQIFQALAGWSILAEMRAAEEASRMADTEIAQPANFVLQVGLAALWRSWGIEPAAIVGHSVGEVSAAYVAGVLSLEEALTVSYHRSRIQKKAAGTGKMLAVGVGLEEAKALLAEAGGKASIAAVNGPTAITLAGEAESLEKIAATLEARGVFNRFLRVEVPYHSPCMDPLLPEVRECLAHLQPKQPTIPIYSTVSGDIVNDIAYGTEYWCQNIRNPVWFAKAIQSLYRDGHTLFLEVGPHPALAGSIKEVIAAKGGSAAVSASLRREKPEVATLARALAELYAKGCAVDWQVRFQGETEFVDLPKYAWQREHYWQEPDSMYKDRLNLVDHPLLGIRQASPEPSWKQNINGSYIPYLPDHVVDGVVVLPGAAYVEAGLAIGKLLFERGRQALTDLSFHKALVLDAQHDSELRVSFDTKRQRMEVHSRDVGSEGRWSLHAVATISGIEPKPAKDVDLAAVRARCGQSLDVEQVYAALERRGLRYGTSFRGMREVFRGSAEVLARIESHAATRTDDYLLHPAILDAAFQSLISLIDDKDVASNVFVPVAIRQLRIHAPVPDRLWSLGSLEARDGLRVRGHLTLCDDAGHVVAEIRGLTVQALAAAQLSDAEMDQWFYRLNWRAAAFEPLARRPVGERWLILADQQGIGRVAAAHMVESAGIQPVFASLDQPAGEVGTQDFGIAAASTAEGLAQLLADQEPFANVLYCWGLDVPVSDSESASAARVAPFHQLILALSSRVALGEAPPRLYLLTRDAYGVAAGDSVAGFAQAPLIGVARVAVNEYPFLRTSMIDLGSANPAGNLTSLCAELLADSVEDAVAIRDGVRYVQRCERVAAQSMGGEGTQEQLLPLPVGGACQLEIGVPGQINSLRYREVERRAPESGEIEVAIKAVALNFKDVAKVMNFIGDEALSGTYFGHGLGMEAGAVVERIGADVTEVKVGDRLVLTFPDCFRTHATVRLKDIFYRHAPDSIPLAECSGVPSVFITVHYALRYAANLQAGETVLIHSGTGGVGLAAIQVARSVGAQVIATVGSAEKEAYLRAMGIEHVFHSRSLNFVEDVMGATGNRGVDVVLNALPGEYISQSLAVLAPFGRFVELGKRDMVENSSLPLGPFNENLSFTSVDVDRLTSSRPELADRLLGEIHERMISGVYHPLPIMRYPAAQAPEAFKLMARAQHIGKVVVSFEEMDGVEALPLNETKPLFDPEGSFLVTGGLGGFGLVVARWLVNQGVKHLILVGRRGAVTEEASEAVQALRDLGANVLPMAADVADTHQLARLFADIAGQAPPLKGIFHSAAVLDDGSLADLNQERFQAVMMPKARGAWNLHLQSRDLPLDHFVLFSSVSALIGNARQGNYVAANAFLDALAGYRAAQGLAAMSINWGAIGDTGMAADEQVKSYLALAGLIGLKAESALNAFARAARWDLPNLGIANVDWQRWALFEPTTSGTPRFSELLGEDQTAGDSEFRILLSAMEYGDRVEMMAFALAEQVAQTLRIPSERVELRKDLSDFGLDSLTAVELQTAVRAKMGVELSALELLRGASIAQLAEKLLEKMKLADDDAPSPDGHSAQADATIVVDQIDELSDAAIDELLKNLTAEEA